MILALDTTSEYGSIALLEGAQPIEEIPLHSLEGFSSILFGEIEAMLARHSIPAAQIECFAAASGPGSFTGVRVGLSAVKGLAEATGRPAFGVSNLQALALFGSEPLRAAVLDAKRGEVYGAVYDCLMRPAVPETVGKISVWLAALPRENIELISADFDVLGDLTAAALPRRIAPRALASAVGRIAWERYLAGEPGDPAAIDANYVRRSGAEILWKG